MLHLQRSAGNQATARLVQRWINGPKGKLDTAAFADMSLDDWLEERYLAWVRRKRIPEETKQAIKAKVKSWIEDDAEHSSVTGKRFTAYEKIFDMARVQVGPSVPDAPVQELEMIDAAPLSPPAMPYGDPEEMEEEVIPTFRRESSVPRELGPPEYEADSDDDRAVRREKRSKDYRKKAMVYYRAVPHNRRAQDKTGTVPATSQEFSLGPLSFELQGGASHRMTAKGGGSAPTYAHVLGNLLLAAAPKTDADSALRAVRASAASSASAPPERGHASAGRHVASTIRKPPQPTRAAA